MIPFRHLTKPALDAIARRELLRYSPNYFEGAPSAAPLELIAENSLGLSIEYACLSPYGDALGKTTFEDGFTGIYDKTKQQYIPVETKAGTIYIDDSLILDAKLQGRYRYTLAHEMAHWILHKQLFSSESFSKEDSDDKNIEWQADYLAQAILMPKGQVQKAYYAKINEGDVLSCLANVFEVSKQAMNIRLKVLGLHLQ